MSATGRLLYLGYHRPAAWLGDLIKDGGPRQRRLTEHGRLAMIEAATRLPSLPAAPPAAPRVHFLTGARYWHQTAFLLTSLAPHLPLRPVVHDDGTLAGYQPAGGNDISVLVTIPEPGTGLLAAVGLAAFLGTRRRRGSK